MINNVSLYFNLAVFLLKLRTSERWRNNTPRNRNFPLRKSSRIELPNPTMTASAKDERKSVRCARGMPDCARREGLSLGSARGFLSPAGLLAPLSRVAVAFFFLAPYLASHSTFEILYIPLSLCVLAVVHITIVDSHNYLLQYTGCPKIECQNFGSI